MVLRWRNTIDLRPTVSITQRVNCTHYTLNFIIDLYVCLPLDSGSLEIELPTTGGVL